MDGVVAMPNKTVFEASKRIRFIFEQWRVTLQKTAAPDHANVEFDLQPACADMITLHASITGWRNIEVLSKKKQGDKLIVSGRFVAGPSDGAEPSSADKFELSYTVSGSMRNPEYLVVASSVNS